MGMGMGGAMPTGRRHHVPWGILLSLVLVAFIGLCITGLIMGWISLGKKPTCPEPKVCPACPECPEPEPMECPDQPDCPVCEECEECEACPPAEPRECPVCPVTECPECPQTPVTPQLQQQTSGSKKPVVVEDCNTSPGCPKCMVWDGKRCRYPRGFTKMTKGPLKKRESFMLL